MLIEWDAATTVAANLDRLTRDNAFGKGTRVRVAAMLRAFKARYLLDADIRNALVVLAQGGFATDSLDRVLYALTLRSDRLLHDAVIELLLPAFERGRAEIDTAAVLTWLREQQAAGRMGKGWGDITLLRVAQHLLATLRDFGVLAGAVNKRITPPFLPVDAFAFVAKLRQRDVRSGDLLLHDLDWRIFFLPQLGVERLFLEAHQEKLLEFHAAGRVVRITFPADTLEAYARFLVARTH